jgi:transglutaminase-like putative cysteine protease
MTTEEFNALPLEARRFIELHAGCLSCGNKESKLTKAYELYKVNKMANVYVLFGGGINYSIESQRGVLYNIRQDDTPAEIRAKLDIAARIKEVSPEAFISYDQKAIDELIESLPEEEVIKLDPVLSDEEKAALAAEEAQRAADAEAWAERSAILGIDTKTADYPDLQAYVAEKAIEAKGKKKKDLIAAIDAISTEDTLD